MPKKSEISATEVAERLEEQKELTKAAWQAVVDSLSDGAHKYPANLWRNLPAGVHMEHAKAHLRHMSDEDIRHAICRLAMVLVQRRSS